MWSASPMQHEICTIRRHFPGMNLKNKSLLLSFR
eukprot:UN28116